MIHFDITNLENELSTLEKQTTENNFWENSKNSSKVLKRITEIKNKIEQYKKVHNELNNFIELNELLKQENDEDLEKDLENRYKFSRKRNRKIRNCYITFWKI